MNKAITSSIYEPELLEAISHHLNSNEILFRTRILKYSVLLQKEHGGDIDTIYALVFLNKLGDKYFEFTLDNTNIDIVEIENILQKIDFPKGKINTVINYLSSLGKDKTLLKSTEEKIVNDAIILAGFGAAGLIRLFSTRVQYPAACGVILFPYESSDKKKS